MRTEQSTLIERASRLALLPAIYAAWLVMMALHEGGHVLHAWISGGEVRRVVIPLWGFSLTELGRNPRATFVAWGGAIWGSILPIGVLGLFRLIAVPVVFLRTARWFAAFCLVANGAYFFAALIEPVGDAADLIGGGVPKYVVAALGAVILSGGLFLWHTNGARRVPRGRGDNFLK